MARTALDYTNEILNDDCSGSPDNWTNGNSATHTFSGGKMTVIDNNGSASEYIYKNETNTNKDYYFQVDVNFTSGSSTPIFIQLSDDTGIGYLIAGAYIDWSDGSLYARNGNGWTDTTVNLSTSTDYVIKFWGDATAGTFTIDVDGTEYGTYTSDSAADTSINNLVIGGGSSGATWTSVFDNVIFKDTYVPYTPPTENWLGTWAKRRKVVVSNTNIDSNLTHFPLLLTLGTSVGLGNTDVSSIFDELTPVKEDFTTYTEVDPASHITVATDKITFTDLPRNASAYVYKDKEVNHFDGDFEHLLEAKITAWPETEGFAFIWTLANAIGAYAEIKDASGDMLSISTYHNSLRRLQIRECDGGTPYESTPYQMTVGTLYYLRVKRDESVGTYGTLYLDVYSSDADRTNEENALSNQSLTLHTSKKDYRYIYGLQSWVSTYQPTNRISGYIENLDLQETQVRKKIALTKTDGTTELYGEIEKWDDANETAVIWVSKDDLVLSSTGTTDIYMYYDSAQSANTTYIGDTNDEVAENVWDSNYKAVYHMADGASTSAIYDSTLNDNDGTKVGAGEPAVTTSGKIGNAQDFDGTNDYINLGASLLPTDGSAWSATFWTKYDTGNTLYMLAQYQNSATGRTTFYTEDDSGQKYRFSNSGSGVVYFGNSTTSFVKLSLTCDASGNISIYYNGAAITTDTGLANIVAVNTLIGAGFDADGTTPFRWFNGILDEVKISSSERTAAWEKADYYTGTDALVSWSTEEEYVSTATGNAILFGFNF